MSEKWDVCKNRRCGDVVVDGGFLCPSCRWLARWAFGLGAFVAGMLSWVFS